MSDFPTAEQEIVTTTPEPVTNELKEKGRILGEAFYKDPAYLSLLYPNKEETRQKTDPFLFPEEEELKEKKLSLKTATLVNLNIVQDNINLKGTYPPLKAVNLLVDLISRQLITYSPDQLNQLITNTDGVKAGLESIANPVIKQAMESVKSWPKKLIDINPEIYQNRSLPELEVADIIRIKSLNAAWVRCQTPKTTGKSMV